MVQTVKADAAIKMLQNGDAVLIDVREADEFKAEHIAYALSLPLSSLETGVKMLDVPPSKTILFHCLKGTRGQMACERVQALEECRNSTMNIEGGIEAWKEQGLPVVGQSSGSSKLPVMRQVQIIVGFLVLMSVVVGFLVAPTAFAVAGFFGAALMFAGITGWCGLAMLLSKMPWNR